MLNATRVGYVILLGLTLGVAVRAYRSPVPTFDRLLYAATVAHLHILEPNQIAQEAFQLAGRTDYPHTAFTDQLLAKPTLIAEQIPFYAIRPLYMYALSLIGLRAVSPLAYIGIALILVLWVRSPWWVIPTAYGVPARNQLPGSRQLGLVGALLQERAVPSAVRA